MPRLLVFLLSMVLLASPATALTLTVTNGLAGVLGGQFGAKPAVVVGGDGFTLNGGSFLECCLFSALDGTVTFEPVTQMPFASSQLTLNGVTFGTGAFFPNDSILVFTNDPFPGPTPMDPADYHGPYMTTFTMTGHSALGGPNGVDLDGKGILTVGLSLLPVGGEVGPFKTWTFNAPEPSPLILLALSVGILAILVLRGRFLTQ